ncbi:MAG: choice-of-anchor J domain-containing protein, partial [Bacteroidota bacterium]
NIKYSSPGSYPVTLIVSNGVVSDTMTKNPYITVTGYPSGAYLDFESLEDFTLVFEPWTTVDAGGGITYGINGISYPHQYAPMAYICFVPSNTSPALTNMAPHSGQKLGCCFSSEPPSTPNNKWLISPKLTLGNNAQVEFWVQSYNSSYGDERYNIAVSTTDLNPSSFLSLVPSPEIAPSAWTKKSYSLSSYANQTVYIGIQCVTDNGFIFMIDDIAIGSSLGIHEPAKRDPLNIYPNPARDRITLNLGSNSTGSFSVELLNLYGETTRMWKEMGNQPSVTLNIGGISPGIYIVRLHTTDREINRKIMILN